MANDKVTVQVRLPEAILDRIDGINEELGFTRTRAEYIAKSVESMFRAFIDSRIRIDEQMEPFKDAIDPSTIVLITKRVTESYMKRYESYGGPKRQVLIRIPTRFVETIDEYQPYIGLYDDLQGFIRMAVSNQLDADKRLMERMERVKEHRIFQQRSTDDIVNSVLDSLTQQDSDQVRAVADLMGLMIKEASKEDGKKRSMRSSALAAEGASGVPDRSVNTVERKRIRREEKMKEAMEPPSDRTIELIVRYLPKIRARYDVELPLRTQDNVDGINLFFEDMEASLSGTLDGDGPMFESMSDVGQAVNETTKWDDDHLDLDGLNRHLYEALKKTKKGS